MLFFSPSMFLSWMTMTVDHSAFGYTWEDNETSKVSRDTSVWSDHSATSAAILTWQCKSNEASVLGVKRDQTDWTLANQCSNSPIYCETKNLRTNSSEFGTPLNHTTMVRKRSVHTPNDDFHHFVKICDGLPSQNQHPGAVSVPAPFAFALSSGMSCPNWPELLKKPYSRPNSSQEKFWDQTKRLVHFLTIH